jgi:hypothetical protein
MRAGLAGRPRAKSKTYTYQDETAPAFDKASNFISQTDSGLADVALALGERSTRRSDGRR